MSNIERNTRDLAADQVGTLQTMTEGSKPTDGRIPQAHSDSSRHNSFADSFPTRCNFPPGSVPGTGPPRNINRRRS